MRNIHKEYVNNICKKQWTYFLSISSTIISKSNSFCENEPGTTSEFAGSDKNIAQILQICGHTAPWLMSPQTSICCTSRGRYPHLIWVRNLFLLSWDTTNHQKNIPLKERLSLASYVPCVIKKLVIKVHFLTVCHSVETSRVKLTEAMTNMFID